MRTMPCVAVQGDCRRDPRADRHQVPPMRHDEHPEAVRARTRAPRASFLRRRGLWLYLPSTVVGAARRSPASRCALASADWSSASASQNPTIKLSVMSSGMHLQHPFSWRGWQTRPFVTRLSGTTLPPSTAGRGVARWTSSLRAIRASRSRRPASAAARRTLGTCGRRSPASRARSSRRGCSLRTSPDISTLASMSSFPTLKAWGAASRRDCSRRLKSALGTGGRASSCWQTPTAAICANRAEIRLDDRGPFFLPSIDQIGGQIGLSEQAKDFTLLWLLMRAAGLRATAAPGSYPYSHPVHLTLRPGSRSLPRDLIFNPAFLELVMGWPIGWTETGQPVTAWSRWLQRMRGALSALPSIGVEE